MGTSTDSGRGIGRKLTVLLLCSIAGLATCKDWEDWDNVFRKRWYGWKHSDNGYSIVVGNRVIWLFGDTFVHEGTAATDQEYIIGGNTLAVHNLSSPPYTPPVTQDSDPSASTGAHFFARNSAGAVRDITWSGTPGDLRFFGQKCNDNQNYDAAKYPFLMWPGHGMATSAGLAVFSYETHFPSLFPRKTYVHKYGNYLADPSQWTCQPPVVLSHTVQYSSLNQPSPVAPDALTVSTDPPLQWGIAIVNATGGGSYIFGTRLEPGGFDFFPDAKLAWVSVPSDVYDENKWFFYYAAKTNGCTLAPCFKQIKPDNVAKRNDLATVAQDVAPEFSVDLVSHTETGVAGTFSGTQYVMVHGTLAKLLDANGNEYTPPQGHFLQKDEIVNFRTVVMRSSSVATRFPRLIDGIGVFDSQGNKIGSTAIRDIIAKSVDGYPPADREVISGYNAYRSIHALKGHAPISQDGSIVITYHVWRKQDCPVTQQTCDRVQEDLYYNAAAAIVGPSEQISRFRFTKVPVKKVWPWCQAHGPC